MKLTLEKDEIRLIGQLVLEIEKGLYNQALLISAVLIWEFKVDNASVFERPERIKRKLKMSTFLALRTYLRYQTFRGEVLWDMTLGELKTKLERLSSEPKAPQATTTLMLP